MIDNIGAVLWIAIVLLGPPAAIWAAVEHGPQLIERLQQKERNCD